MGTIKLPVQSVVYKGYQQLSIESGRFDKEINDIRKEISDIRKTRPDDAIELQLNVNILHEQKLLIEQEQTKIRETIKRGVPQEDIHSVVVVGANGSGKSRLGWFIQRRSNTVLIAAQKELFFERDIRLETLSKSKEQVLNLSKQPNRSINNYTQLLSALIASESEKNRIYKSDARLLKENPEKAPDYIKNGEIPEAETEVAFRLWKKFLSHRKIGIKEGRFFAKCDKGKEFNAAEMSDGEKVAFYIMANVLLADPNATIIIDEPETHLHKAILNRLFDILETERSDCTFVYITHDLTFAASRKSARKIWVKEYSGDDEWNYQIIPHNTGFPEELLFQVMGSRTPILFVEGDTDSLDLDIYSAVYPHLTIIPLEGCGNVIRNTRSFRNKKELHHNEIYGLVDRDYRGEDEIEKLNDNGVFVLDCAEVENLFLIEEVIIALAEKGDHENPLVIFEQIKNDIISRLKYEKEEQIAGKTKHDLKRRIIDFKPDKKAKSIEEIQTTFSNHINRIQPEKIYERNTKLFDDLISSKDYKEILKHVNDKRLFTTVSKILGYSTDSYFETVKRFINGKNGTKVLVAIREFLPTIPLKNDGEEV